MLYRVTAFLNESDGHFFGYELNHTVHEVDTFDFEVTCCCGPKPRQAADGMWTVGNRMDKDLNGRTWPTTQRSLSVGDVVKVFEPESDEAIWMAVDSVGWRVIDEPAIATLS